MQHTATHNTISDAFDDASFLSIGNYAGTPAPTQRDTLFSVHARAPPIPSPASTESPTVPTTSTPLAMPALPDVDLGKMLVEANLHEQLCAALLNQAGSPTQDMMSCITYLGPAPTQTTTMRNQPTLFSTDFPTSPTPAATPADLMQTRRLGEPIPFPGGMEPSAEPDNVDRLAGQNDMQKRAMLEQLIKIMAVQAGKALHTLLTGTTTTAAITTTQSKMRDQLQTFATAVVHAATANAKAPAEMQAPKYVVNFMTKMPLLVAMLIDRATKTNFRTQTIAFRQEQHQTSGATLAEKLANGTATPQDFIDAQTPAPEIAAIDIAIKNTDNALLAIRNGIVAFDTPASRAPTTYKAEQHIIMKATAFKLSDKMVKSITAPHTDTSTRSGKNIMVLLEVMKAILHGCNECAGKFPIMKQLVSFTFKAAMQGVVVGIPTVKNGFTITLPSGCVTAGTDTTWMKDLDAIRNDMVDESRRLYHILAGHHDAMLKAMMRRYVTVGATSGTATLVAVTEGDGYSVLDTVLRTHADNREYAVTILRAALHDVHARIGTGNVCANATQVLTDVVSPAIELGVEHVAWQSTVYPVIQMLKADSANVGTWSEVIGKFAVPTPQAQQNPLSALRELLSAIVAAVDNAAMAIDIKTDKQAQLRAFTAQMTALDEIGMTISPGLLPATPTKANAASSAPTGAQTTGAGTGVQQGTGWTAAKLTAHNNSIVKLQPSSDVGKWTCAALGCDITVEANEAFQGRFEKQRSQKLKSKTKDGFPTIVNGCLCWKHANVITYDAKQVKLKNGN